MKKTITQFLYMIHDYTRDDEGCADFSKVPSWTPTYMEWRPEDSEEKIFIRVEKLEVSIPDDFDPVPAQTRALEAAKQEALAEYQKKVAEINKRLSELQAITA